jgi:hypothetical protein
LLESARREFPPYLLPVAVYLGLLVGLSAVLPLLYFDAPLYYDEALFLVYGEHFAQGVEMYEGLADHKGPGIHAVSTGLNLLFSEPYVAGRVTVYAVNLLTAIGIWYIAARFRNARSGAIAGFLYIGGVYLPHFVGYFFLTEPFANLFLVLAAIALLTRRLLGGVLAGVCFAIAGLFNQLSLLIGLPTLCLLALEWRSDDGLSFSRTVGLFLATGVGFLVPLAAVAGYFHAAGTLDEVFRYTVVVPLMGYSPPFGLLGHIYALVSFLPVWMLVGVGFAGLVWQYRAHGRLDRREVFLFFWLFLLGLPGATRMAGDHMLLFAFPPACVVAALVIEDGYEVLFNSGATGRTARGLVPDLDFVPRQQLRVGIVVVTIGVLTVAAGANGFILAAQVDESVTNQAEAARQVDSLVDGPAYTLPFRHYVYYFSDDVEPPQTFAGLPYSDSLTTEIVQDLEAQEVRYIIVPANRVTDENKIATVGLFLDARERIIRYANENYHYEVRTDQFVIFERTNSD